jgi:FMN phosphatase YigB (HAD superfamily)
MIKNFLFDLDGTLLPMNMEIFTNKYLASICKKMSPIIGIEPKVLVTAIWKGVAAMAKNDGSEPNKSVFWKTASEICKIDMEKFSEHFDEYYLTDFIEAKKGAGFTPYAKKCVDIIKSHNKKLIAATNPIFPEIATMRRLNWAGVSPNDFEYITVYENSSACKPNLKYYNEICEKCNIIPEESIMIGNDVDEDMCAAQLGFDTFLITDCIINRNNKNYSMYKNGSFEDFYNYLVMYFDGENK